MPWDIEDKFRGFSNSGTDLLPCPRCNSLRSRRSLPDPEPYTRRYECKDCGQYYRWDCRPPEMGHGFYEREGLVLPNSTKQ